MEANFESPLFLINALVASVFFLAALLMHFLPPKEINSLYGYRTKNATKNQSNWDLAQEYSKLLMIRYGVYLLALSLVGLYSNFETTVGLIISLAAILILCFGLYLKTEKTLKDFEHYEKNHSNG